MHKYKLVSKKGEGTFSEVLKAQSINTGKFVAIKCMKNHYDSLEKVNNMKEIQALRKLSPHKHIIKLLEVLYDEPTGRLALVFELMDMNLYELIRDLDRDVYVHESKVKIYIYQLLKAIDHMHKNGIFHRDIKPENILITDDTIKLADLGSCRGIIPKQTFTEYISTRWYRAPECLLTDGYYNYKMDLWGAGCVWFEILSKFPLFPGNNELDQINKIHNILGTPSKELLDRFKKYATHMELNFTPKEGTGFAKLLPNVTPECLSLIEKLLTYNPDERLTANQALKHPYFKELREQEKRIEMTEQPSSNENSFIHQASISNHNVSLNLNHSFANNNNNSSFQNNPKKKDRIFPDIKANNNYDKSMKSFLMSDDSENENLPPIKGYPYENTTLSKAKLLSLVGKPKSKMPSLIPSNEQQIQYMLQNPVVYQSTSHKPINKKMNEIKRNYISPYSQKAISHKLN